MSRSRALRLLPFLHWRRPTASTLRSDLVAGLTVALLAIPQCLAYAQLAGMPAQHGLYAALIPSVVGVLFGSSALLSTGPVALTSLLTFASVAPLAAAGSTEFVGHVLLLALLAGAIQVAFGVARAGILVNLLSQPVMAGFINAAAIVIALSQLPSLTGIAAGAPQGFVHDALGLVARLGDAHLPTVALAGLGFALLVAARRLTPRIPGVLVMAVVLTLVSWASGFEAAGGRVVGVVPAGMPALSLPSIDAQAAFTLVPAAFVIALVSFMEAMSSCKVIAVKTRTGWDENQELVGQGLAKVAAAFSQAMPVSGSFSRSALNLRSGGVTGWSSLFAAALIVIALAAFTPLLHHLPQAALAVMIVAAVVGLIDIGDLRDAWRASPEDGIAAVLTFVATLAYAPDIQNGILAGIAFSLGAFIYRRMLPRVWVQVVGDDDTVRDLAVAPAVGDERIGIVRFDAALFFANASFFEEAVLRLRAACPGLRFVVVPAQGINLLDATGVAMLRTLVRRLHESGVTLVFGQAKPQFREVAERTGLLGYIGIDNFCESDEAALRSARARLAAAEEPQRTDRGRDAR